MLLKNKINLFFTLLLFLNIEMNSQVPLSNLKYWFKCDSFVVKDNFNNVLGWKNSIDTNQVLTNTNLTNAPTFSNNALHFDGIDDYLNLNFVNIAQPLSYIILWKGGNSASAQLIIDGVDAGNRAALIYYSNSSLGIYGGSSLIDYPKPTFSNPIITTAVFDNLNSTLYENGNIKFSGQNVGTNGINGITIGSRFDFVFPLIGEISEILIYNKAISNAEITSINNYLINKYSQVVNLGNDIIVNNTFCDTTLSTNGSFESYYWSNGLTTPTIHVNQSGKYWLRAVDGFGKTSSDTIFVNYPTINYPIKNSFCTHDTLTWDTGLPKSFFTFLWQNSSNDSLQNIHQIGTYSVVINDAFGCSVSSNTITISEDTYPITATLGGDTTMCAGNFISLKSGAEQTLSYIWNNSSTSPSIAIDTTGQYSAILTNTNNCIARDTIHITISGQAPTVNFSNSIGCVNSLVLFSNSSTPPSGNTITSYYWNFGDISSGAANTSTLTNPSHTYTNVGTYTVSLRVITNAGCEQTTIKTITVFPKPTVNFVSGNSCQNDSTAFSSLCTSVAGYSITSLNWNFGDPGSANTSNLTNPKHVFGNQANYTIKLVATNNVGCKDSLINIIAVKAQVKADFTYSTPCTNTTTVFQDNSIVPAPNSSNTRTWNFGVLGTSNSLTPSKTYTSSGVYYVTLSVTGNNGCNSSITKLITIFSPPIASFSVPTICVKDTFMITNTSLAQSGIISTNDWKLNNNYFSSTLNPTLNINAAGTYSVKLTTTNSFGCENSATNTISVNAIPNVDFTTVPSSYYYINSPITLTPNIQNASSYLWNISNYTPTSIFSPTVTFTNEGDYTASLILVDPSGCKNSVAKTLSVSKRFLDVSILNVISNKDDDGFVTVQADIANYGSIPISVLDLNYQVSDGGNIKEIWNGILNPSSFFSYTFSSKTSTQLGSTNNITCVEIKKVNTINDENASNNSLCSSLNSDEISVSNPIPNPTNADITLPVILNKDIDITISIYNSTGQIQYEETTRKGITGLNLITLPTSSFSRGCYIIKANIDDKVFIKKFIKLSN